MSATERFHDRPSGTVGCVGYREFAPPVALRDVLECGWAVGPGPVHPANGPAATSGGTTSTAVAQALVLPDGGMDLIWSGGALLVAGPDTEAHPVRRTADEMAYGLRFRPGTLPALLGVPAVELRDRRVSLDALLPRAARDAVARLESGAPALAVLLAASGATPSDDPALRAVVTGAAAGASAADTADALGWTTRTLHRRCRTAFGYGQATLRRVLRFRAAHELLLRGVPIADAAARTGYADQPHLSRDVRALTGMAPAQLASGAYRSTPVPSGSVTVA